jgi:dTDP-4-dehydrorhamnose 3,5-epimerase/reductase
MSVLVTGGNGQLGLALREFLPGALYVDLADLDISSESAINNFDFSGIETIINAAAYTNVDGSETSEGRLIAWAANATAVKNLAKKANEINALLVHISSDYVFDGTKQVHDEDEPFSPISVYGASKAAGDIAASLSNKHYVLRTSWVVGEGKNFVKTMFELANKGVNPSVVDDQIGRLTFASELARGIDHLVETQPNYGTYNLSCEGEVVTWHQIAAKVYELAGHDPARVSPTSTIKFYEGKDNIAPRPTFSQLSLDKIKSVGFKPAKWEELLEKYVSRLKESAES